jgi:hypothetical protein
MVGGAIVVGAGRRAGVGWDKCKLLEALEPFALVIKEILCSQTVLLGALNS